MSSPAGIINSPLPALPAAEFATASPQQPQHAASPAAATGRTPLVNLNASATWSAASMSATTTTQQQQSAVDAAAAAASAEEEAQAEAGIVKKSKSLYLALVLKNVFHYARSEGAPNIPAEASVVGNAPTRHNPATLLRDDDYLRTGQRNKTNINVPTDFMKFIDLLLRLEQRRITCFPKGMLRRTTKAEAAATGLVTPSGEPYNYFGGYALDESRMYLSPDGDEAYVLIHADRDVLLSFAERQSLRLRTNPYSVGAGAGRTYSKELDEALAASARSYFRHFPLEADDPDEFCRGKYDADAGEWSAWGFCVEPPQKMRLLKRLLHESWAYGGCGLQLEELADKKALVLGSFFLHNKAYLHEYGLVDFCSFWSCCSVLSDKTDALVKYFAEATSLYFLFMQTYCRWLILPALLGIPAGIISFLPASVFDFKYHGCVGAAYAGFMILWAVTFLREWTRSEQKFACRYGQDVELQDEMLRDEYQWSARLKVHVRSIFRTEFDVPLNMSRLPTGEMVELQFPSSTRTARRWLVSYPILLLTVASMVAALLFIEIFRFDNQDDDVISIAASILSSIVTIVFKAVGGFVVALLSEYENESSATRLEQEKTNKIFMFLFVAQYFSSATILFFPEVPNQERRDQLLIQLVTQLGVMPLINNAVEYFLPIVSTSLRRRADQLGGSYIYALCSYVCCCAGDSCAACNYEKRHKPDPERDSLSDVVQYQVWKEAQLSPAQPTADEYIEVVLSVGYALIFASLFAFSSLCLLVWGLVEIKVDLNKLLHHQRPLAKVATTIGAPITILWSLIVISIASNAYCLLFIHDIAFEVGMTRQSQSSIEQKAEKTFYFSALEHIIIGVIVVYLLFREGTPATVQRNHIKIQLLRDKAVQQFVQRSLALPHDVLLKQIDAPLRGADDGEEDGDDNDDAAARRRVAQPCTEVNRHAALFFILTCLACGAASILLDQWLTKGDTSVGLLYKCVASNCTAMDKLVCSAGGGGGRMATSTGRSQLVLAMASLGTGLAFVPMLIVYCVIRGRVLVLRLVFLTLSMCAWIVALVMVGVSYPWCGNEAGVVSGFDYGLSMYLALASAGGSLAASGITLGAVIARWCCREDATAGKAAPRTRAATTMPDSSELQAHQQQQQQVHHQPQPQVQERGANYAAPLDDITSAAPAAAAIDMSSFDERTDPAVVGIDATFAFMPGAGLFYSDAHELFYDPASRRYGTAEGQWQNPQTQQWEVQDEAGNWVVSE